jgi:hypothetical protein
LIASFKAAIAFFRSTFKSICHDLAKLIVLHGGMIVQAFELLSHRASDVMAQAISGKAAPT